MTAHQPLPLETELAMTLIRQALEICDTMHLGEPACHLQMGLELLEDPQVRRRSRSDRKAEELQQALVAKAEILP